MRDAFDQRSNERDVYETEIRITGAGAATPTATLTHGVAVTYLSATGKYRATWADNPGLFLRVSGYAFQATTPSDLRGYTVVFDDYVDATATADGYLDFWIYDSTFTLADLTSTQQLSFGVKFKRARSL